MKHVLSFNSSSAQDYKSESGASDRGSDRGSERSAVERSVPEYKSGSAAESAIRDGREKQDIVASAALAKQHRYAVHIIS